MTPFLVLAQTTTPPNPYAALTKALVIAQQNNVTPVLRDIGLALLALFALLEVYRLWIGGDTSGLVVLGIKVIIVNYLITTDTLRDMITNIYGFFAQFGQNILANNVLDALNTINQMAPILGKGNQSWGWALSHFVPLLFGDLMLAIYFIVLAILFALYTFAVVASGFFIALSILLVPIILPLSVWGLGLMQSYLPKWVATVVHAVLMPVIAAIALIVAINLGALEPLKQISKCLTNDQSVFSCWGVATQAFMNGLIGSLVGIFLMFGLDGIVRSFVGGAEVSAAGVMAFRMVAGIPGRVAEGARAASTARAAAAPQTVARSGYQETTNIGPGGAESTTRRRTFDVTTSQKVPQSQA